MIGEAIKITPMACLSRCTIGMRTDGGHTCMIVNLPGKPKAVAENFEILMRNGILSHAIGQMKAEQLH
jgi:molybdopterin biosynthesis enzyme MoaB